MPKGFLVGMAVGDALGMPFETLGEKVHKGLEAWDGTFLAGTWHKLPAGHWTDDTEMAVCLAESLISKAYLDPTDVANRYLAWSRDTPHGMGGTVRAAMAALAEGKSPFESGVAARTHMPESVGSGTCMRVAPLGAFYAADPGNLVAAACTDANITHDSPEARAASVCVAAAVAAATSGEQGARLIEAALDLSSSLPKTLTRERLFHVYSILSFAYRNPEDLCGRRGPFVRGGQTYGIVPTALYCAAWGDSYIQAVEAAVRLGGDCDTRAAITGAIKGAQVGRSGIPTYLRDQVLGYSHLVDLEDQLEEAAKELDEAAK